MPDVAQKSLRDRYLDRLIYDVVKAIALFLFSSGGAVAATRYAIRRYSEVEAYRWPIGVAVAGILVIIGYGALTWFDRDKPWYAPVRSDWVMVKKEMTYRYLSHTKLQYTKAMTIKARRPGLERYVDKFNWTGQGTMAISSMVPEHVVRLLGRRNIWRMYEVSFGRALRKNDRITLEVKWDLDDPESRAVPFFSQSINERTDVLVLKLRLPAEFSITRAYKTILPTIDALEPISTIETAVDQGELDWVIRHPRLLHCYQISWTDPAINPTTVTIIEDAERPREGEEPKA